MLLVSHLTLGSSLCSIATISGALSVLSSSLQSGTKTQSYAVDPGLLCCGSISISSAIMFFFLATLSSTKIQALKAFSSSPYSRNYSPTLQHSSSSLILLLEIAKTFYFFYAFIILKIIFRKPNKKIHYLPCLNNYFIPNKKYL